MLMKNKIVLVLLLTILCLSIGSVCATAVDEDSANPNNQIIVNDAKINEEEITVEYTDISKVEAKNYNENFDDIIDAAHRYQNFVKENKTLPNTVKVGQHTYSHEDFTYLMAKTIKNINAGDFGSVTAKSIGTYTPSKETVYVTLPKDRYLTLIDVDLNNIAQYGRHANNIKLIKENQQVRYEVYSYGYAKILTWYDDHDFGTLPNTCLFDSSIFKTVKPKGTTVTIDQILDAAQRYQKFVKNNKFLPETVKVGNKTLSKQEFTYAMAQAIYQINNGNKKNITIPASVKMCSLKTYECNIYYQKGQYVDFARYVAEYVRNYSAVPSYVKYAGTYVPHKAYAAAFANILSYYKNNGKLANYALFTTKGIDNSGNGAGPVEDEGYPYGLDVDALKDKNSASNSNLDNPKTSTLPNTGNPILVLLFALAVLPIIRIKK